MKLVRFAYLPTGTLGRLYSALPGGVQLFTVERPWSGNAPYVSCIPEGQYALRPHSSPHWPEVLEVVSVPGRTAILIHPANAPAELQGCIAPNMELDLTLVRGQRSKEAFKVVMSWYRRGDSQITVIGVRTNGGEGSGAS
jgi:hypothetical protein